MRQLNAQTEIGAAIPVSIKLGIFNVNCEGIRKEFIEKHVYIADKMLNLVYMIIKYNNYEIRRYKDRILKNLSAVPTDIRSLFELKKYMEEIPSLIGEITKMIMGSNECYDLLDGYV